MSKTLKTIILVLFRIVFTGFVLATILFIFQNSLESGALSSARSAEVTALVNSYLAKLGIPMLSETVIRKLAHYGEFFLLGFLLTLCVRVYTYRYIRYLCWPLLLGLLVANLDETIQLYSVGRSSSVMDVWIDFSGVCTGLLAALALLILLSAVLILLGFGRKKI